MRDTKRPLPRLVGRVAKAYLDLELSKKMIVLYVFLLLLPMLLCGYSYFYAMSKRLGEQYDASKSGIFERSVNSIENNLDVVDYCARCVQTNAGVVRYIESMDFSNAQGVGAYLEEVRPVFAQLRAVNGDYDTLCVYRKLLEGRNDPDDVLNADQQPNLERLARMNLKDIRLLFTESRPDRAAEAGRAVEKTGLRCHLYKMLYSDKYTYQIGYFEIVCSVDKLLGPLGFFGEGETLALRLPDDTCWRLYREESGALAVAPLAEADGLQGMLSLELPRLGAHVYYGYPPLHVLERQEMMYSILLMAALLVLMSALFLVTNRSVTSRVTNFTLHLQTQSSLTPYAGDAYRDEIGQMIERFNQNIERQIQLGEEVKQRDRLVSQAQYYAMQSQIRPHFLYNTLESIDMLIAVNENQKASKMIALFGRILRYNMSKNREISTLGEEARHITDYLRLYAFKMPEDFRYTVEIAEAMRSIVCPYCMLQPLVENSLKHGFQVQKPGMRVCITAAMRGDLAELEIRDNGCGVTRKKAESINAALSGPCADAQDGRSIGLKNVADRIRLLCGERSSLRVLPREDGFSILIVLTAKRQERSEHEYFNRG